MYNTKLVLTYHALTPVHVGSGTSVSYVDNPIQREKHTDFPVIAGSGIKGVIRELATRKWKDKVEVIFGPERDGSEHASCISFTDAKILLFPVRSVKGVFAWITSPYVLKRFKNELESLGISGNSVNIPNLNALDNLKDDEIIICDNSELKIDDGTVALEEFVFNLREIKVNDGDGNQENISNKVAEWIWSFLPSHLKNNLQKRLAIVSDDVFKDFVKYAVEIRTRIRIDQMTGTVEKGKLFTIELVPAEAVFYGFVFITEPYKKDVSGIKNSSDVKKEVKDLLEEYQIIQLGGDETLGMGLMRVNVYDYH